MLFRQNTQPVQCKSVIAQINRRARRLNLSVLVYLQFCFALWLAFSGPLLCFVHCLFYPPQAHVQSASTLRSNNQLAAIQLPSRISVEQLKHVSRFFLCRFTTSDNTPHAIPPSPVYEMQPQFPTYVGGILLLVVLVFLPMLVSRRQHRPLPPVPPPRLAAYSLSP